MLDPCAVQRAVGGGGGALGWLVGTVSTARYPKALHEGGGGPPHPHGQTRPLRGQPLGWLAPGGDAPSCKAATGRLEIRWAPLSRARRGWRLLWASDRAPVLPGSPAPAIVIPPLSWRTKIPIFIEGVRYLVHDRHAALGMANRARGVRAHRYSGKYVKGHGGGKGAE